MTDALNGTSNSLFIMTDFNTESLILETEDSTLKYAIGHDSQPVAGHRGLPDLVHLFFPLRWSAVLDQKPGPP
jgi:hypothetical protein